MTSNSNTESASEHDIFRTCYQCPHRKAGCHSVCEGYSARVAKQQEIYKMRLAQSIANPIADKKRSIPCF